MIELLLPYLVLSGATCIMYARRFKSLKVIDAIFSLIPFLNIFLFLTLVFMYIGDKTKNLRAKFSIAWREFMNKELIK